MTKPPQRPLDVIDNLKYDNLRLLRVLHACYEINGDMYLYDMGKSLSQFIREMEQANGKS